MLCKLKQVDDLLVCSVCGRKLRRLLGIDPGTIRVQCGAEPTRERSSVATPPVEGWPSWWPVDPTTGERIQRHDATWENVPCRHRVETVIRTANCELCTETHVVYEVRECAKHGECSLVDRTLGGKLRDCFHCGDREAAQPAKLVQLDTKPPTPKRSGPVRVCIVTPDCGAGGTERWMRDLAASLPADLAEVVSIAIVRHGQKWDPIIREIVRCGATVYGTRDVKWGHTPLPDTPVEWCASDDEVLRRAFEGVDVVMTWGITGSDDMLAQARWRGPHVVVAHGNSDWTRRHLATTATPYRVAVSQLAAQSYGPGPTPRVIWNGSSAERLRPLRDRGLVRAEWGLESTDLVIGQVGRISPEKNPKALALAVAELQSRLPDRRVRGVLIGSGLPGPVEEVIADARAVAGDAVQIIPPPRWIGDAYAAIDVGLLCSDTEGFGLVYTEAMLVGVPQVVTATGIVPEIQKRWPGVLHVVPFNPTARQLGSACLAALDDTHRQAVRRGRQIAWEEFSAARMGESYGRYFQEIMNSLGK
jgi:glycosyltransferase involved in cell wall biosynthesis